MLDLEMPVCKQRCGGQVRQEEAIPQADKSLHAQSGRLKCFFETAELLTGATQSSLLFESDAWLPERYLRAT